MEQDIWDIMYKKAIEQFKPTEISPFVTTHHVVCAIEAENGEIYTGFCIESASGVMNLCAERVAWLNMYLQSGQTIVKRLLACRNTPPTTIPNTNIYGGSPCGACREFFMQASPKNANMEILTDYNTRQTTTLSKLMPNWWGWKRYNNANNN